MTMLTIEIPDKVEKTLAVLVEQVGGKVISTGTNKKPGKTGKKSSRYWMIWKSL